MYIMLPKRHFGDATSPSNKKTWRTRISTTFQSSWCSNPESESWATRVACPNWNWRKNRLSILVSSLGSAFQIQKKDLRNKHSICFLELQLLKIEINRTLSQSYVFNTNPRLCPDNFSCCKNKSTRVMTKHHWIPIAPSVLKLANIANLLGD